MRTCGDCALCCKVLGVHSLDKPRDRWCQHCTKRACKIYDERPDDCRAFDCAWLKRSDILPDDFRPDRCGFVITSFHKADQVEVHLDKTSARLDHRLPSAIRGFLEMGMTVLEVRGDQSQEHRP